LYDKALTLLIWGAAIAVFATVGWMALCPDDPYGVVRLSGREMLIVLVQILALTAIVAALTTALVGRKLPDVGTFAVSAGLASANLRGHTSAYLLVHETGIDHEARRSLCAQLAGEAMLWFAIIVAALVISGLVMRWCYRGHGAEPSSGGGLLGTLAAADLPVLGARICGAPTAAGRTAPKIGLLHFVVTVVIAVVLIQLLAAGTSSHTVKQGQVYFSLAAAFFIAAHVAYRFFPVHTAAWACLAVPAVCMIGYGWTMYRPVATGAYADIASVPPTAFIRALPVEYISIGTASVIASFWSSARSSPQAAKPDR
jgi:hypothetical protein